MRLPAERQPQPGPKFNYKLAWFERLIAHAVALFGIDAPVVLAGDFNVVPTDIYPTKSWPKDALVQPASRACFTRMLEQGWTDAIRALHPSDPMFTFWDYKRNRRPRDARLRLDHLLLNLVATSILVDAGVDREIRGEDGASDHAPAWIRSRQHSKVSLGAAARGGQRKRAFRIAYDGVPRETTRAKTNSPGRAVSGSR
jgi:exodeoxyribonuclease-3